MKRYINLEDFDGHLTVTELKAALIQEEEANKLKEKKETDSVKKDFSNVFLKTIEDCILYGKTLKVYHLKDFVRSERTTDWDLIYYFDGSVVSFSKRNINNRELQPNRCGESFSEKELRAMSVISEEEYNKYVWHFEQVSKQLEHLIQ